MRSFGYRGWHRQLQYEMLQELTPIDAVDASSLRPGTHNVEVARVQHNGGSGWTRVTFRGLGGRMFTHPEWGDDSIRVGDRYEIHLKLLPDAHLFRTASGSVVGLDADGRLLGGPFPDIPTARKSLTVARIVLQAHRRLK